MNSIGIIVNPASGKDIRRLISYGSPVDNMEKLNTVRRIFMGAMAAGIKKIYYMPEYSNIVEAAVEGIFSEHKKYFSEVEITKIDMPISGTEADTTAAAYKMKNLQVKCVIILGGDGTCRAAAKEIGDIPVIPVSTGTNNVFPEMTEGTIAGMVAGAYANERLHNSEDLLIRTKRLDIYINDTFQDIALIDAVVLNEMHIASRAVWKTENFKQIILTCCSAGYIGVSSIGGQLAEITKCEPKGLSINVDAKAEKIYSPLAPGLFVPTGVNNFKSVEIGEKVNIDCVPCIIAVDGERNIELFKEDRAYIELTWNGPKILNARNVLAEARNKKIFFSKS